MGIYAGEQLLIKVKYEVWNTFPWIQDRVEKIEIIITLKEMYPNLNWKKNPLRP